MAQTLLPASSRRTRRPAPGRTAAGFFPRRWSWRSRRWACELPAATGVPLARWHCADLARAAVAQGITASVSDTTIWRWLSADAIKPWRQRSWIFPRDPDFAVKAARVLDLYARTFDGTPLGPNDPLNPRTHPTGPPRPGRPLRVEHEYDRGGALAYLAAWDVGRAKIFGRCEATTGIDPFMRVWSTTS